MIYKEPYVRTTKEVDTTIEAIINLFNTVVDMAEQLGYRIQLDTHSTNKLSLYYHNDYPNMILVDKADSGRYFKSEETTATAIKEKTSDDFNVQSYCEGSNCKLRDSCLYHNPTTPQEFLEYHDFSREGSGGSDMDDEYMCGDLCNYAMFYNPMIYIADLYENKK